MNRPGKAFQDLVAQVETTLLKDHTIKVESPAFLVDKDGHRREHDVLITRREHMRTYLTAIECKDLKRKVGVPALEAFRTKCDSTGINSAVLVSSSGFTKSALKTAKRLNVQCFTLQQLDQVPWVNGAPLIQFRRRFSDIEPQYTLAKPAFLVEPIEAFYDGNPITWKWLEDILHEISSRVGPPIDPNSLGSRARRASFDCASSIWLEDGKGIVHLVAAITIDCVEHDEIVELAGASLSYGDDQRSMPITSAQISGTDFEANIILIKDP